MAGRVFPKCSNLDIAGSDCNFRSNRLDSWLLDGCEVQLLAKTRNVALKSARPGKFRTSFFVLSYLYNLRLYNKLDNNSLIIGVFCSDKIKFRCF